jgi:hypothetical protein
MQVEEIESRFGVKLDQERQGDLQIMYGMLLESIIPRGEAPLSGREAEVVRSFRDALRISDEAAAETHLDVGRRLTRALAEGGSREASARERKVRTVASRQTCCMWCRAVNTTKHKWTASRACLLVCSARPARLLVAAGCSQLQCISLCACDECRPVLRSLT